MRRTGNNRQQYHRLDPSGLFSIYPLQPCASKLDTAKRGIMYNSILKYFNEKSRTSCNCRAFSLNGCAAVVPPNVPVVCTPLRRPWRELLVCENKKSQWSAVCVHMETHTRRDPPSIIPMENVIENYSLLDNYVTHLSFQIPKPHVYAQHRPVMIMCGLFVAACELRRLYHSFHFTLLMIPLHQVFFIFQSIIYERLCVCGGKSTEQMITELNRFLEKNGCSPNECKPPSNIPPPLSPSPSLCFRGD